MDNRVLYLANDEVTDMVTMEQAIDVVEETFEMQAKPDSIVWGDPLAYSTEDRDLGFKWRLKTAILRDIPISGLRVTGFNVDENGVGSGGESECTRYIVLSDPETTSPVAIIDEHYTFALRTSALPVVASKYLAKENSSTIGLVGVGNVNDTFVRGIQKLFNIEKVKVTSTRPETREKFADKIEDELGLNVVPVETAEEVCEGADIVSVATPVREPFIESEWIEPGTFFVALGPDEVDAQVYTDADKNYVDWELDIHGYDEAYERMIESDLVSEDMITGELWQVATGDISGREHQDEIITLKSVGLTIQDIAIGYQLYEQALENDRGILLPFN